MYRILTASKDAYITDKIINNSFRATDGNTGQAGTLDLFKLFNETTITGSDQQREFSRLLLKFDISTLSDMLNDAKIDINDNTFNCELKLHDIYGGQTTPSNFNVIVFPLAQNFSEGSGYDVSQYEDIDATNFITASISNGSAVLWNAKGAMESGSLGVSGLDVYTSGTLAGPAGSSLTSLTSEQHFVNGTEDLCVNVTKVVSGVISGQIPDYGFLVGYSGSFELNKKSYFVKRFASRNAANTSIRPKLIVKYDDSIQDNHQDFIYDVTSSLYLNNFHYDSAANIIGGGAGEGELTGNNCMVLKLETGSFKKTFNVSQAQRGDNRITGLYSASFAVSSFETLLRPHILATGSVTFDQVWTNSTDNITYLSSSLTITNNKRFAFENFHQNLLVTVTNLRESYNVGDVIKIRVFSENRDRDITFKKLPFEKKSQIYHQMHYRVRDFKTSEIVIPFDTVNNSTRLSTDASGMYFEFYLDSLYRGRTYVFDFLIKKNGFDTIITDAASKFRID